jgi:hypothetical protein
MNVRGWLRRAGYGLLLVLAAWIAVPGWQLARCVLDDDQLDHVVVAVALDWRDFGEAEANERLRYELDARGLAARVPSDACGLRHDAEGVRSVACTWNVAVEVPLVGAVPLGFGSTAGIDANDVLLR